MTPLEIAAAEWSIGVKEPDARINKYIREGLGWTWLPEYIKNGQFQWCGAFAAYCYRGIRASLRLDHFASTYRLRRWARNTARWVAPRDVRPGDIAVVGRKHPWGDHITLVDTVDAEGAHTIEGNATGRAPCGAQQEGVIRTVRRLTDIRYAVRPLPEDFGP